MSEVGLHRGEITRNQRGRPQEARTRALISLEMKVDERKQILLCLGHLEEQGLIES